MKIGRLNIEFYNARKHRPVVYGFDHLSGESRDMRPFATADIQSILMMISNRMKNVVWQSKPEYAILQSLFEMVGREALNILTRFFYDGYVRIDVTRSFDPKIIDGDDGRIEDKRVVTIHDDIYLLNSRTRAEVLRPHIDMLNAVNDSDLNLIVNYGAMGILSPENSARTDGYLDDEQVGEIQEDYRKKYGLRFGRWAMLITRTPVKFQPIQLPIRELQLQDKRKSALAELLQYMNIPKELHAQFESAKYANRNEAELDMYSNCVTSWAWKFTEIIEECYRAIRMENDNRRIYGPADIWFDIVGVAALQEAQWKEKEKAREELAMWRELRAEMPEKSDLIDTRIDNLIESL